MSRTETASSDRKFYQVVEGEFRTRVPEGTEGAIVRKLQKGPNAGREVWEVPHKALIGTIESVGIDDGEYGKQLQVTLDTENDGKHPVLSFGTESKDGRDLMKKLPSVDFSKEVRIMPYRFVPDDRDTEISGISITQPDEEGKFTVKIENHFFDPETKGYLHGFPTIDWDKASEEEQKIYKIQRDGFLVKYLVENVIPKVSAKQPAPSYADPEEAGIEYPEDEVDPKDIPF